MTSTPDKVAEFFERYAAALLARDEATVATLFLVASLILFPGQSNAVTDAKQTARFFAASCSQYEGIETVDKRIVIMGEGPGTVWADVTWSYGDGGGEHFCYQLIDGPRGFQIAVLTLLD